MKLEFDALTIDNFKAITGAPLTLDMRGRGSGLHFVRGRNIAFPRLSPNGACKSTLWHALTWCLYGKTADNLRNPDIRPWRNANGATAVALDFAIDRKPHRLERTAEPNRLALDGRAIAQEVIGELVRLPFEVFINTILFGQGRPLFFDLEPRHKLELFTEVLGLERWEQRSAYAADVSARFEQDLARSKDAQIAADARLAVIADTTAKVSREHDLWQVELAKRQIGAKKAIADLEKRIAGLQKQRDKADLEYDSAETEIKALRRGKAQLEDYMRAAIEENAKAEAKLVHAKGELARIERLLRAGKCPTCGAPTDKKQRSAEIKALESQIAAGIGPVKQQLAELRQQLAQMKESFVKFEEKAAAANDVMIALDPQLADANAKLAQLKGAAQADAATFNPHGEALNDLRKQKKAIGAEIKQLAEDSTIKQRRLERTRFWVKGFKEVRLYVVEQLLSELELAANVMAEEFGLVDWRIMLGIERETKAGTTARALNVEILSPENSKPVRFESWSGGEGQRLRLIGSLALAEVLLAHAGVNTDLTILDEPSRSLGDSGIDDLIDSLSARARQRDAQIFFTEHRVLERGRFASTLTVTREHDGVRLA